MKELSMNELDSVCGGAFPLVGWYVLGIVAGMGAGAGALHIARSAR